jgi:hypothetical protein
VIRDVAVEEAGSKGRGVFALRDFAPGEFIFRRRNGRVEQNAEIPTLSDEDRTHLCELDRERTAIPLPPGSYLNHSCYVSSDHRLEPWYRCPTCGSWR